MAMLAAIVARTITQRRDPALASLASVIEI
jgi:hypothetical protein